MKKHFLNFTFLLVSMVTVCSLFLVENAHASNEAMLSHEPVIVIEIKGHVPNNGVNDNWMSVECDGTGNLTCKYPVYN